MTDTSTRPDAIALLTADHAQVEGMFRQIEALPDGDARTALIRNVVRVISVHTAAEERVLYPAMRRAMPDGGQLVQQAIEEHRQAKEALAAIEAAESPAERDRQLVSLMATVRAHVHEEEIEMFPRLRASLAPAELDSLGPRLARARRLTATHPPTAATPPATAVRTVAAAMLGRARDALRRA